ncbi:mCG141809 [Mus musculus]|nr:mCG141809 [Mus musculus]
MYLFLQRTRTGVLCAPVCMCIHMVKNKDSRGWRDGSVVKSTVYSSKGPRFNSQHPHGSS